MLTSICKDHMTEIQLYICLHLGTMKAKDGCNSKHQLYVTMPCKYNLQHSQTGECFD